MMARSKQTTYLSVNKSILTDPSMIDFSLYVPDGTKSRMHLFLQSESRIDRRIQLRLAQIESVYIIEAEHCRYENYLERHLPVVAANSDIPVSERAGLLYAKASSVMRSLFEHPEKLRDASVCENIVENFLMLAASDDATVCSLMKIIAHDYYTHTHSINVSIYAIALGAFLGLEKAALKKLATAALLHDLGKSSVDEGIINKNGKLTDEEFAIVKSHSALGQLLALQMGVTNQAILLGIRNHHEKIDGSGYPDGLKGDQIPLFARIIGLCDIFDALTTKRAYKEAMRSFEALFLMKNEMSTHIDMALLKAFIQMMHQ